MTPHPSQGFNKQDGVAFGNVFDSCNVLSRYIGMAVLNDLSGFEFEDVVEDVFRNLGYENVRQADRTADEGRDVIMEEVVDGTRRANIVECKHTGTVGRPVVQKLHSAIATFDFDGPKRGDRKSVV